MKKYTVESYKAGKKAICRNGQEPSEVHYFETAKTIGADYPIIAYIDDSFKSFTTNGKEAGNESPYDLFEQEDVVETWHNVFHSGAVAIGRASLDEAKRIGSNCAPMHITKLTYNPNKPENEQYSVEVVHKY